MRRGGVNAMSSAVPEKINWDSDQDQQQADQCLTRLADQGVADHSQGGKSKGDGQSRIAPHVIGPFKTRGATAEDENSQHGSGIENPATENHVGIELLKAAA